MKQNKRWLNGLLAAGILMIILSCCCFAALETTHDCPGEHCSICCLLQGCRELRDVFGFAVAFTVALSGITFTFFHVVGVFLNGFCRNTPITLRVKLSD